MAGLYEDGGLLAPPVPRAVLDGLQVNPLSPHREMPKELQTILEQVVKCMDSAEPVHRVYRERWDDLYRLYRSYRQMRQSYAEANDRDRGGVILDGKRMFGEELFIPWAFSIVETVVPRLLSQDPHMLVRPRRPDARESADAVQEAINSAQADIGYNLKLQTSARRGCMFGLGVQKTFWNRDARPVLRTVRHPEGPTEQNPEGLAVEQTEKVLYEGPDAESIDIYDFFWDPIASDICTSRWVIHRTWRDDAYVAKMVKNGKWLPCDLEAVKAMRSTTKRDEMWAERNDANGVGSNPQVEDPDGEHEVWEYHTGQHVYTILDRQLVVQVAVNPYYHRELPFQIFRPIAVPGEFVGIGVIEPIANLQKELNVLRGQRRDNATMALMRAFIYREGRADPSTFKLGPGIGIPVQGDPRNDIVPLEFPDLPGSSYREESAIKQDIELATGISESVAGGSGSGETAGTETATGMQLINQAANVRIRLATRNLEREMVAPAGRQWLEVMRQKIRVAQPVRVPDERMAEGYRFMELGPDQLLDDIEDPIPEAGSTEPDNRVDREQRATGLFQTLIGNPHVDQQRLTLYLLKELGVNDADSFMAQAEIAKIDPRIIGEALVRLGVPEEVVTQATELALQAEQDADEEVDAENVGAVAA